LAAVAETEVDVAHELAGARPERVLVPDVGETLFDLALLLHLLGGFGAAVEVDDEDAVVDEALARDAEVLEQLLALGEHPVREILRDADVDALAGRACVVQQELDALGGGAERREVVLATPRDGLGVEVVTD